MIKPTVGRIVWFFPTDLPMNAPPLAAMIAYVHSDTMINVGALDTNGLAFAATSVKLLQDDEPREPGRDCACWMPYQKGQAAKTEELEKDIFQTAKAAREAGPETTY